MCKGEIRAISVMGSSLYARTWPVYNVTQLRVKAIYFFQSSRSGVLFGKKLSDCSSFYRRTPDGAEGVGGVVLAQVPSTSSAYIGRPSGDEVRQNGESISLSPRPARKCATKVSFKETKNTPKPQIVIKGKLLPPFFIFFVYHLIKTAIKGKLTIEKKVQ